MTANYLTEEDLAFQSNNDALKAKAEQITAHVSNIFLDLSEDDERAVRNKEIEFDELKELLFDNANRILAISDLGRDNKQRQKLDKLQAYLLNKWEELGFTFGFFLRLYQVEGKLKDDSFNVVQKERLSLLYQILNEQKSLVLACFVMFNKSPPVILDAEEFM